MAALPENSSTAETYVSEVTFSYKWIINNFYVRSQKILKSSTFSAPNYDQYIWCLHILPEDVHRFLHVTFCLELVSRLDAVINHRISFLDSRGIKTEGKLTTGVRLSPGDNCIITPKTWDKYMYRNNRILPDNTLTVICDITLLFDENNGGVINKPDCESKLNHDLCHLFQNDTFKDVTLIVAGAEIKAHKNILAARSIVFEAMFAHDMEESRSNCVTITDINYEVVLEMLLFIYTGKISNIDNIATELLMAADKYALEDLKKLCEIELCGVLSVTSAVDLLIFADRFCADYLRAQSIKFIRSHFKYILKTQGWQNMINSHAHLTTEVVEAAWNVPSIEHTN